MDKDCFEYKLLNKNAKRGEIPGANAFQFCMQPWTTPLSLVVRALNGYQRTVDKTPTSLFIDLIHYTTESAGASLD